MTTRILVCGGRLYATKIKSQRYDLFRTLDKICKDRGWVLEPDEHGNWLPNVYIIAGGAKGADAAAIDWAVNSWCDFKEYPADWDKYGKRAGYIRNKQMLDEGCPDLVVAFPGGKGTAMMIKLAEEAGIPVIKIDD